MLYAACLLGSAVIGSAVGVVTGVAVDALLWGMWKWLTI